MFTIFILLSRIIYYFFIGRKKIISYPSLSRGHGRRMRGFWEPMGARYASTARLGCPGRDGGFSSQVVTLGDSENATK
jgi:hypothetical protein